MPEVPNANAGAQDVVNRTVRGATQNALASAVVTLFVYFLFEQHGKQLPAAVVAALIVVVAAVFTAGQNIYENKTGNSFLKRVPQEVNAAVPPAH